jgi:AraC family transcriptional regulator
MLGLPEVGLLSEINLLSDARDPAPPPRYFGGCLISQICADGAVVSHVRYDEARRCRRHTHAAPFLAMIIRGGYVETSGRFAAKLRAFEGEVHPEGMDHADEVLVPRTHCLLVEVAGNAGRSAADAVDGARLTAPVAMSSSAVTVGAELFAAMHAGDAVEPLAIECALAELIGEIVVARSVRAKGTPPWIARVRALQEDEFARPLRLAEVARAVDLHPVYVSRKFREVTGAGLAATLRRVRVARALASLATGAPIARVALSCGFADQSHLTKAVRRVTGRTPGGWRRETWK